MSGQWWESDLIVGPFANITEANAWAAANPSSLFPGLLATIGGVPYSWRGAGVGWAEAGGATASPRRMFAAWTPWSNTGSQSIGSTTNKTIQLNMRAPIPKFYRIRIWLSNANQAEAYTGWQGIIAAASNSGASYQPSIGGALGTDPTVGFVSVSGPVTIPAAPAAVGGVNPRPGLWVSPWIDIPSVDALDSGLPWLFIRANRTTAGASFVQEVVSNDTYGTIHANRTIDDATGMYIAGSTSEGGALFNAQPNSVYGQIARIDFVGDKASASVDFVGASTIVGGPIDLPERNWLTKSRVGLRAQGLHIAMILGSIGLPTRGVYDNVKLMISDSSSDYIVMPIFSSNDGGYTKSAVDLELMRYYSARSQARIIGKEIIALIFPHDAAWDSGIGQSTRQTGIDTLYASGCPLLDARLVIGDPAYGGNKWRADYSGDGLHPNNTGAEVLAAWVPGALKILTQSFVFGI